MSVECYRNETKKPIIQENNRMRVHILFFCAACLCLAACAPRRPVMVSQACPAESDRAAAQSGGPVGNAADYDMVRTYQIYFDQDSTDLTPVGQQLVSLIGQDALRNSVDRIRITSHARSGKGKGYSNALADCRMRVVTDALRDQGVPMAMIDQEKNTLSKNVKTAAAAPMPHEGRRVDIEFLVKKSD
jgi:outer membrane protein OmpA-like peptidoglycan-associated protein